VAVDVLAGLVGLVAPVLAGVVPELAEVGLVVAFVPLLPQPASNATTMSSAAEIPP
jgi:hypothetical protein